MAMAVLICAGSLVTAATPLSAGEPSVLVKSQPMKRQTLATTVTCYGTVAPDPRHTVTVSLAKAGRISRLAVTAGQLVRRKAPLLEFSADPVNSQNFDQAVSAAEFARGELRRIQALAALQMATGSRLAAARKAVADAEAALRLQRELGAGRSLEKVTAPFTGIVTALNVKQGERVQAGTSLLELAERGALRVELGVEPEESSRVRVGMPVSIVSLFDGSRGYPGAVGELQGVVDPQTRLVKVIVRLAGSRQERLIPGTRVRGVIELKRETGWAVPRSAVLREGRRSYLFQIERGRARRVLVKTGPDDGETVGVSGNLNPALKVVVVGNYELSDGMAVREAAP